MDQVERSCGQKLAGYISQLNNLVNDRRLNLRDTVANPGLLSTPTPWGTTVGAEFSRGNIAVTIYNAARAGRGRLIRADIYFSADFFASSGEWQGMTFMHELSHVVLRGNDAQIEGALRTGGLTVTDWIDKGCP